MSQLTQLTTQCLLSVQTEAKCNQNQGAVKRPRTDLAVRAQRHGELAAISDALAQLSDRQRAMICRSCLGRTTAEIAAELNTADDVVKNELHQALHRLRMTVAGY